MTCLKILWSLNSLNRYIIYHCPNKGGKLIVSDNESLVRLEDAAEAAVVSNAVVGVEGVEVLPGSQDNPLPSDSRPSSSDTRPSSSDTRRSSDSPRSSRSVATDPLTRLWLEEPTPHFGMKIFRTGKTCLII